MPSASRSNRRGGSPSGRRPSRPTTGQRGTGRKDAELERQRADRRRQRLLLGLVVGGLVLIVVVAGAGFEAWRSGRSPEPPPGDHPQFGPVTVTDGEPITLGEQDAPVTVALYEDFKCPHCADLEEELGPVIADLQAEGSIRLQVYPMTIITPEGGSLSTANAMACAAEQDFGTAYHAGLFANSGLVWSDEQLIALGELVGDPPAAFADCIRSVRHRDWVASIGRAADDAGITGTPAVYINGDHRPQAAEWTPEEFREQVQAAT